MGIINRVTQYDIAASRPYFLVLALYSNVWSYMHYMWLLKKDCLGNGNN
jgi:hypothetical protein